MTSSDYHEKVIPYRFAPLVLNWYISDVEQKNVLQMTAAKNCNRIIKGKVKLIKVMKIML